MPRNMANFLLPQGSEGVLANATARWFPALAEMSVENGDLSLVRRVQAGERSAYDLLVLKYQQKVVKLVMRYVRNPADAEDVAQEAFIKAYRALPQFRGDCAFYTWLYRIAINTAKNALAARDRNPVSFELDTQNNDESEGLVNRLKDPRSEER